MCVAENPRIPTSSVSGVMRLDVQYLPVLRLELGSPTISLHSIQEGNDVYFDCHVSSNPANKGIVWKFNGSVLQASKGVIQSNQTLVLQRVSKSQTGSYECEASNKLGHGRSNTINLKIRFAPTCSSEEDVIYVYGVSLHESVNLVCEVVANPIQVSFNWRFQGNSDLTSFNQINDTR